MLYVYTYAQLKIIHLQMCHALQCIYEFRLVGRNTNFKSDRSIILKDTMYIFI